MRKMAQSFFESVSLAELAARVFTGIVIIAQCCLLDYYIVTGSDLFSLGWIAADILTLAAYVYFNVKAVGYFVTMHSIDPSPTPRKEIGLLPYAFMTWLVYSVFLVAKVAVMFKSFARELPAEGWMGTNMMKVAIGLAAAVFALLIAGHHRSKASERHKFCLKWMQTHVVFELLDTVEFLSILFINEDQLLVSFEVENVIIAYSCINLIMPTVALFQMSSVNFARTKPKEDFTLIQTTLSTLFVNIPYVAIRIYLWHTENFTTALFLMKNFIAIVSNFWELRVLFTCCGRRIRPEKPTSIDDATNTAYLEMEQLRQRPTRTRDDGTSPEPRQEPDFVIHV